MSSTLLSAKDPVYESVKFTTESLPQSIFATTSERLKQYLVLLTQSDQHVHRMDQHPQQPPDHSSVDAHILQVVSDRVFPPAGDSTASSALGERGCKDGRNSGVPVS